MCLFRQRQCIKCLAHNIDKTHAHRSLSCVGCGPLLFTSKYNVKQCLCVAQAHRHGDCIQWECKYHHLCTIHGIDKPNTEAQGVTFCSRFTLLSVRFSFVFAPENRTRVTCDGRNDVALVVCSRYKLKLLPKLRLNFALVILLLRQFIHRKSNVSRKL